MLFGDKIRMLCSTWRHWGAVAQKRLPPEKKCMDKNWATEGRVYYGRGMGAPRAQMNPPWHSVTVYAVLYRKIS